MKKILIALFLSLSFIQSVHADPCAENLGNLFNSFQRVKLCQYNGNFTSITQYEAIAGTGSTQGTGAALSAVKYWHSLTNANGTLAWVLPAAPATSIGRVHMLFNALAFAPQIFPATGATINGAAANAVFSAPATVHAITCIITAANTWICA